MRGASSSAEPDRERRHASRERREVDAPPSPSPAHEAATLTQPAFVTRHKRAIFEGFSLSSKLQPSVEGARLPDL